MNEVRRHRDVIPEQVEVERLERRRAQQTLAKFQNNAVVLAGVGVGHGGEFTLRYLSPRLLDKGSVQRALRRARLRDRRQLRPRIVEPQIVVRDDEPPVRAFSEEVVSTGLPKIRHGDEHVRSEELGVRGTVQTSRALPPHTSPLTPHAFSEISMRFSSGSRT
jgi:hypothetical protein